MTKAKAWRKEQVREVFQDSNTFPQVQENEFQCFQIVFPFCWELEFSNVFKFWDNMQIENGVQIGNSLNKSKRSSNIGIKIGLTFCIWRYEAQVMNKRRAKNQTNSLTLYH